MEIKVLGFLTDRIMTGMESGERTGWRQKKKWKIVYGKYLAWDMKILKHTKSESCPCGEVWSHEMCIQSGEATGGGTDGGV